MNRLDFDKKEYSNREIKPVSQEAIKEIEFLILAEEKENECKRNISQHRKLD